MSSYRRIEQGEIIEWSGQDVDGLLVNRGDRSIIMGVPSMTIKVQPECGVFRNGQRTCIVRPSDYLQIVNGEPVDVLTADEVRAVKTRSKKA